MTKSGREIVEILRAYDLTQTVWSAAQLAGVDPKTVERYVALRDAGRNPFERERRPRAIDPFLAKVEEWVDDSLGKIRADVAHRKLVAMGFTGNERSTRRGGRRSEGGVESRPAAHLPAVGPGAGAVAAVRLGQGP